MTQKFETIVLKVDDGNPAVEVFFGHAHIGNYKCYLWDQNAENSTKLAHGNNVDGVVDTFIINCDPNCLDGRLFSYETIIQAAEISAGQFYSLTITVRQQGNVCKSGVIHHTGTLDDTKAIIGFRKFKAK